MTVPRALMMAVKTAIQSRILRGSMSKIEEPSESSEEEVEEPSSFLLGVGVGSPAGLVVDGASGVVVAVAVASGVVVSALATVTPDKGNGSGGSSSDKGLTGEELHSRSLYISEISKTSQMLLRH